MTRVRRWAPVAYPVLLVVAQVRAPRRSGPLALAQVFAPWLFLPLLFLLPFAVALRDRALPARWCWRRSRSARTWGRPASRPGSRRRPARCRCA